MNRTKDNTAQQLRFCGSTALLNTSDILITMVDSRTNYAKDITTMLREAYGRNIKIFENHIPMSVRAQEASTQGISIFRHDPKGKVAQAYQTLTEEVIGSEKWCKQY